jgi:DNA (cytosine-5)-methyltransferase 1
MERLLMLCRHSEHAEVVPIVDLFAGPGGWSEGLKALGHSELGIEWDDAACATARAAGHERFASDVAALDPLDFPCVGLIASPPCQAWSMAGKGGGRRDKELCVRAALELAAGNDTRAELREQCEDERSMLVVEPLRWALALRPEWVVLEQVPPVLEMWTLFAQILSEHGYSTWAGVLEAERYGVPQTRERAILMASRTGTVHPPRPTHQRYVPGEPQRHDITLEGEVLPWVSMAQALGWDASDRVGFPRRADDGEATEDGYRARDFRDAAEPAFNLAEKARSTTRLRAGTNANDIERPIGEPAPTLRFGERSNAVDWVQRERSGDRAEEGFDPHAEPCQTLTSNARSWTVHEVDHGDVHNLKAPDWPERRPATTGAGDSRIFQPGNHREDVPGEQSQNAVRVTVQEASILQSFRSDYPWQGSRSKQFQQIGNAVPPLLAQAVLHELVVDEQVLTGRDALEVAVDATDGEQRAVIGLCERDLHGESVEGESGFGGVHDATVTGPSAGTKSAGELVPESSSGKAA